MAEAALIIVIVTFGLYSWQIGSLYVRIDKLKGYIEKIEKIPGPPGRDGMGYQGPQGQPGWNGPTGMMGAKGDPGISPEELRILYMRIDTISLMARKAITEDQFLRLHDMMYSPDTENLTVAEEAIKQLNKNG